MVEKSPRIIKNSINHTASANRTCSQRDMIANSQRADMRIECLQLFSPSNPAIVLHI